MSLKGKFGIRASELTALISLVLFCISCGDYFRPVANPVLQPGGDPQKTAHALVVSSNGANPWGTALVIDVTGDTAVALFTGGPIYPNGPLAGVGADPVHATNLSGTDIVINRDDNSVSTFILPTITQGVNPPNIITLPQPTPKEPNVTPAVPVFGAVAQGTLYVAESNRNGVAVVSISANTMTAEIPVGVDPVALVATPDGTQLYSLNQGDNTISVIFPATNQNVDTIALPAGATPVLGAVSADGTSVFIVNQGTGTVSQINTLTDTIVPGTAPCPQDTFCVGPAPNYIAYEGTRNRAYVTSPTGNSLSIIDNNLGTVQTVSTAGLPCNGQHPISVTGLADGSRVYVADNVANSVCILNTTNNTFTKRICLVQDPGVATAPCIGSATPISIASNSDATRVYTANTYGTAAFPIASISRQNSVAPATGLLTGVVTVTTTSSVPFVAGHSVTIAGVTGDTSFNGVFGITGVNTAGTQFTYVQNGLPDSALQNQGTATVLPFVSLIQTSSDTLVTVQNSDGTTPPLTIPAGGTPTFMTMTP